MADRNSNAAYDLSGYEAYEERHNARREIKTTRAPRQASVSATGPVLALTAAGFLLVMCISSKADIAAVHAQVVAEEAVVEALEQENTRMKTELESKSSMKAVESYAENILGMQKLDKSQVEYISLESGNKAEISEEGSNIFTEIKKAFDNFVEYLKG